MTQVYYSQARSSTAHRYGRKDWDEAKNRAVYGEQYSVDGLGHNFEVRLGLIGDAQMSGAGRLAQMIDHKFLDNDVDFFKNCPSTLEMIASFLFHEASVLWGRLVLELEVRERSDLSCRIQNGRLSLVKTVRTRDAEKVYDAEFEVTGEADSQSGLLLARSEFANKIAGALEADMLHETKWNQLRELFSPHDLCRVILRDALSSKVTRELK